MRKRYSIPLGILVVVVATLAVLLRWHAYPATCAFALDVPRLRTLATSLPGERPVEVRVERFAHFTFPGAMVYTGGPLSTTPLEVFAYQLVYADGSTFLVDAALTADQAKDAYGDGYDPAAWARLQHALGAAKGIVVTHEHADHIGGLLSQIDKLPDLDSVHLTTAQLAHPENWQPAVLPPAVAAKLKPLDLQHDQAIAPGVVLVPAAGHTPGSLLVYVQLADGRELLLTGDTAWHRENIEQVAPPPLFVHLLVHNDLDANYCQLKALDALQRGGEKVAVVPGHDARVVDQLLRDQLLVAQYK